MLIDSIKLFLTPTDKKMIFDDLLTVNTIIGLSLSDKKSRDDPDPEVERFFNSSPSLLDQCMTYELARVTGKKNNSKDDIAEAVDDETVEEEAEEKKAEDRTAEVRRRLAAIPRDDCFRPVPIAGMQSGKKNSALTELLTTNAPDTSELIIYLPTGASMSIYVGDSSNFEEIKSQILKEHEQNKLQPPLHYHAPDCYEIRMHEGDGEPDMDFPAMGKKTLAQMKVENEYCLCEVEGKNIPPPPPGTSPASSSVNHHQYHPPPPPSSGSSSLIRRNSSRGNAPPVPYDPNATLQTNGADSSLVSSYNSSGISASIDGSTDIRSTDIRSNDMRSNDIHFGIRTLNRPGSFMQHDPITMTIIIGEVHETLDVYSSMSLRDLLPEINKRNKLRLFSDEFAFSIAEEDQVRLKIMSPITDLRVNVHSLGVQVLELQKRQYADSTVIKPSSSQQKSPVPQLLVTTQHHLLSNANVANLPSNSQNDKKGVKDVLIRGVNQHNDHRPPPIMITNTTGGMYQEWTVVKKNKYGLRQDRIFGVDAVKVYNKNTKATGSVHRAERLIADIRKIEMLDSDRKSFRVLWADDRDVYDIEYTCANTDDCSQIVAKLLFLVSTANHHKNGGVFGGGGRR